MIPHGKLVLNYFWFHSSLYNERAMGSWNVPHRVAAVLRKLLYKSYFAVLATFVLEHHLAIQPTLEDIIRLHVRANQRLLELLSLPGCLVRHSPSEICGLWHSCICVIIIYHHLHLGHHHIASSLGETEVSCQLLWFYWVSLPPLLCVLLFVLCLLVPVFSWVWRLSGRCH